MLQLLTFAVTVTVTGICGSEPERHSNDALALAVGLDMRKWWMATGPTYLNHVSKGRILEVVSEAVDANAAASLAALKKDAVVTGAEQTLAGTGWLPSCLCIRTAEAELPGAATDANEEPGESELAA